MPERKELHITNVQNVRVPSEHPVRVSLEDESATPPAPYDLQRLASCLLYEATQGCKVVWGSMQGYGGMNREV